MSAMKGRTTLIIAHNDATIKLANKVVRVGSAKGPGSAAGSTTLEVLPTAEFFATGGVTPGK